MQLLVIEHDHFEIVDATWQRERCPSSQNPTTVLTALKSRQKGPKKRYLDHPDIVPGYHAIVVDMVPEKNLSLCMHP
jgi:hypothetical protein